MSWQVSDQVWACASPDDRAGDLDQVHAIAWALDPHYRCVDLHAEFGRLRAAREPSCRPLPRFIVGIGRKRLGIAKAIRHWSGGRTRLVHIGRLRCSIDDLDYLVTTRAYPTVPSPKILCLDIAPSDRIRRLMSGAAVSSARPRWINVFLGNPLNGEQSAAPARLRALAYHLDRLAAQYDRDLLICGAPRTRPELYDALSAELHSPHEIYRWRPNDPANPFEAMVKGSTDSIVTADSISVISQLVAAGHRTLILPWKRSAGTIAGFVRELRSRTVGRRGKDTAAFRSALYRRGLAAELSGDADFAMVMPQAGFQDHLFQRLRSFLQ